VNGTLYVTQAGAEAFMAAGLAGWTNLKADALNSPLPAAPDRLAVIGDFVLAAYTGYAQAAVAFTGPWVRGAGGPVYYLTGEIRFPGPSSGAGINCVGFVLTDGTTHTVWAWIALSGPISLNVPTDVAGFVLELLESLQSVVVVLPV
jgi:hypothetical protein